MPGEERFIVVLMVDMRNSSHLAETRLPFDAVFIVDRFITAAGSAVEVNGGRISHFLGDGLMATFGLKCPARQACLQALHALAAIGRNIAVLNRLLMTEGGEALAFGVGIYCGSAVVGEIGYGAIRTFTTLGDAANAAARLESLCKDFQCEAVISSDVWQYAGLPLDVLAGRDVSLRGRSEPLRVHPIERAEHLANLLPTPVTAGN